MGHEKTTADLLGGAMLCSLCRSDKVATLHVPGKGAICLDCLKQLNITVGEFSQAPAAHRTPPLPPSVTPPLPVPPVSASYASNALGIPDSSGAFPARGQSVSDSFEFGAPRSTQPWKSRSVGSKKRSGKRALVGWVLGGLAGVFLAMMILRFGFGINPFVPDDRPPARISAHK